MKHRKKPLLSIPFFSFSNRLKAMFACKQVADNLNWWWHYVGQQDNIRQNGGETFIADYFDGEHFNKNLKIKTRNEPYTQFISLTIDGVGLSKSGTQQAYPLFAKLLSLSPWLRNLPSMLIPVMIIPGFLKHLFQDLLSIVTDELKLLDTTGLMVSNAATNDEKLLVKVFLCLCTADSRALDILSGQMQPPSAAACIHGPCRGLYLKLLTTSVYPGSYLLLCPSFTVACKCRCNQVLGIYSLVEGDMEAEC